MKLLIFESVTYNFTFLLKINLTYVGILSKFNTIQIFGDNITIKILVTPQH